MINQKSLKTLEYDKILNMLSVYAASETGKRGIFNLSPSSSYDKALSELNMTKEADKVLYTHTVSPSFSFDDVTDCLMRAKKLSTLSMGEVLKIGRLLKSSRVVFSSIGDLKDDEITIIRAMAEQLFISFTLEKDIYRSIISETEMADNASSELKSIRQSIVRCNDKIREKLNSYITSSSTVKYLQDNIITMRNDRYVIPVKSEHRGQISGLIHDQSQSGSTVFVEPMMVVELNNELKILMADEEKEIYRILKEFTTRISVITERLSVNQEIMTELDMVFAKALFSKHLNAKCPEINSKGYTDIINGRHPLIEKDVVVPVSIRLGEGYKILMITGPNTGGKTVTLKLLGLLTLMGLSGMFIPASEGSSISVFDNIWCDIGDEQSIEQSLSTFSSHMTNLIGITDNLVGKSLVLLDELGAGTDPQEGAALAMAITSYILKSGSYGVITTHYPELKEFALVTDSVENASMDFNPDTFKPSYSLVIGIPGASNAIHIASRLGLKEEIVEKAKNLLSEDKIKFENVLLQAEEARRKADDVKNELEAKRNYLDGEIKRLEHEKNNLLKEKEKIQNNAQRETKRLINEAMSEVNEIIGELKEMLDDAENIDIFKAHKLRKKLEDITTEDYLEEKEVKIEAEEGEIKEGDKIFINSLKNFGVVESINKKGEYTVKMGALTTTVRPQDAVKVKSEDEEKKVNVIRPFNMVAAKPEINLIGQTSEEALYNLDKFINDAVTGGLNEVRIVHGKGTGTLRKAVSDYLKSCPFIEDYRKGVFGEGENGVTIVKFGKN